MSGFQRPTQYRSANVDRHMQTDVCRVSGPMTYPGNPHANVTGPLPNKRTGNNLTISGTVPTALAIGTNSTCVIFHALCHAITVQSEIFRPCCHNSMHTPCHLSSNFVISFSAYVILFCTCALPPRSPGENTTSCKLLSNDHIEVCVNRRLASNSV